MLRFPKKQNYLAMSTLYHLTICAERSFTGKEDTTCPKTG